MATSQPASNEDLVPPDIIPPGVLPPLRVRDLPPPVPLAAMIGPSVMLAGLALGSGELVLWPYITSQTGFVFFWACLLGVATQYFINLEIERWTLATGESAITGFCRQSRHWAGVFLFLNIVPWMIPAWAKGSAQIVAWLIWPASELQVGGDAVTWLALVGLLICGGVLTAGPVVYETVERIQLVLVSAILVLVVILGAALIRGDAVAALVGGLADVGTLPPFDNNITPGLLLGALAFAGAGGTLNLGQSNYIKDKGYGMGRYIGRITSPITGREEPVAEFGYHFPHTPENMARWRAWWRAACIEHFVSFFLTCVVCLVLLTLIAYSIFYAPDGTPRFAGQRNDDMGFVWIEAETIGAELGTLARLGFLLMGVAILLTTEFGVLDLTSRISTDIVKVNWFEDDTRFTESRLYYLFLWGTIGLGAAILLASNWYDLGAFVLFKLTSGLNGAVMFLYCGTLLYLNRFRLPPPLRTSWPRMIWLAWGVLFYGGFAAWAMYDTLFAALR